MDLSKPKRVSFEAQLKVWRRRLKLTYDQTWRPTRQGIAGPRPDSANESFLSGTGLGLQFNRWLAMGAQLSYVVGSQMAYVDHFEGQKVGDATGMMYFEYSAVCLAHLLALPC